MSEMHKTLVSKSGCPKCGLPQLNGYGEPTACRPKTSVNDIGKRPKRRGQETHECRICEAGPIEYCHSTCACLDCEQWRTTGQHSAARTDGQVTEQ